MEKVYVMSKQPNVVAQRTKPNFKIEFKNTPVLVDKNIADILVQNPNFQIVSGNKIVDSELDLNKDGVVDAKDATIASKVLANQKKIKKESE